MKNHAALNRIYRLVWSRVNNCWVAVAETAKGKGKSKTQRKLAALIVALLPAMAWAGLEGGVIVGGQGVIVNPNLVQQNSSSLAINAQAFSVGVGEIFTINQNLATDLALIRVLGQNPSNILGSINAKGQLFVSNPNGVLFGLGAEVNVGGLVATSLDINSDDFMAGNITFYNKAGAGSVVNKGNLTAAEGGYIALLAPEVRNEGIISATLGTALLASGDQITLTLNNGVLVDYNIDKGTFNGLVENKHLIQADGGQVFMSGKAADALTTSVVNNTGILRARTVQNQAGVIKLMGDMQSGTVNVGGTLDASAPAELNPNGGNGGLVETSAAHVKVANGTRVTTLAANGESGTWLIDPQDYTIGAGGDI
jgi:filamentous hemagglutinin family protein